MNKVILVGRLARDPDYKRLDSGVEVCKFTVAVDRRFTNAKGEREADFISCVAWRKSAEFVNKYFRKGMRIGLEGSIQARSYEQNGAKRYATEVIVDNVEFVESKRDGADARDTGRDNDFVEVDDNDLPF